MAARLNTASHARALISITCLYLPVYYKTHFRRMQSVRVSGQLTEARVIGEIPQEVHTVLFLVSTAFAGAPRGDGPVGEAAVNVVGSHFCPCEDIHTQA